MLIIEAPVIPVSWLGGSPMGFNKLTIMRSAFGCQALGRVDIRLKRTIAAPPSRFLSAFPALSPVIPAKAGIQTAGRRWERPQQRGMSIRARHLVRIRIYGIIGFSGFAQRAPSPGNGKRSSIFVLARFTVVAKIAIWAKRNPENHANPENPDSDKYAQTSAVRKMERLGGRGRGVG